jgi:phosphopantetheinyl transferase (holo-ACP synthase)
MQVEIVHTSHDNVAFSLAFWAPSETDAELLEQWQLLGSTEKMPALKASHRMREWLGTRLLISKLGANGLGFLPNGKPVLVEGCISISHCKGSVAVVLADVPVGLDIQEPTEQIFIIRSKFCSPNEWSWLESHAEPARALTLVWSAKEAIFKYWGERVDFAGHIEVLPFHCDDEMLEARYMGHHGERMFRLWHSTRGSMEIMIAL